MDASSVADLRDDIFCKHILKNQLNFYLGECSNYGTVSKVVIEEKK